MTSYVHYALLTITPSSRFESDRLPSPHGVDGVDEVGIVSSHDLQLLQAGLAITPVLREPRGRRLPATGSLDVVLRRPASRSPFDASSADRVMRALGELAPRVLEQASRPCVEGVGGHPLEVHLAVDLRAQEHFATTRGRGTLQGLRGAQLLGHMVARREHRCVARRRARRKKTLKTDEDAR